jgi:hypothetical protein
LSNRVRCVGTLNATANCDFSAPFERYGVVWTSCKSDTIFYSPMRTLRTNKPRAASYLYTHTMKVKKLVIIDAWWYPALAEKYDRKILPILKLHIYRTYLLFVRFDLCLKISTIAQFKHKTKSDGNALNPPIFYIPLSPK